jgi:hypothetical protein
MWSIPAAPSRIDFFHRLAPFDAGMPRGLLAATSGAVRP